MKLLVTLLVTDATLIAVHILNIFFFRTGWLDIGEDRSVAEFLQYLKFGCVCLILATIYVRTKSVSYLAWIPLFSYLLVDDSFSLHETLGRSLSEFLSLSPSTGGLMGQDIGQVIYAAIIAPVLFAPILFAYMLGSQRFRRESNSLCLLVVGLAGFAVGVDLLHALVRHWSMIDAAARIIEESGEMITVSLMVWYSMLILQHQARTTPALTQALGSVLLLIRTAATRSHP